MDGDWLAEGFEVHRARLRAVAYRMLGSVSEADDAVQDVRVPEPIVSPEDGVDPEHEALLADAVGLALLVVLETLTPTERLAFVLRSDGGAAHPDATVVVRGARAVAERAMTFASLSPHVRPALVNGVAGVVVAPHGRPFSVMAFTVREGRIVSIVALADPDRLAQLDLTALD